jgi:Uma2 family endonuclease
MRSELRFTIRDLELLPENGSRYEIIDGELFVSTPPHWRHQFTCKQFIRALDGWDSDSRAGILLPAPGVIFAEDQAVAPDIAWVSRERFEHVADADGKLHAAPDLVIEVLSPGRTNEDRDREVKLKLYSRQGTREYWIADWQDVSIQVYRREQGTLRLVATLTAEDTLTSPLLPGFAASVRDLCASPV